MTDKETEDKIKIKELTEGRRKDRILFLAIIAIILGTIWMMWDRSHPPSNVNTNVNTLTSSNPRDGIVARAEARGYYYQSEYAELQGMSVRTLQRRSNDGRLSPPATKDSDGRVKIELLTKISE